jgi:prepilin-type N-terminal cleavage/methylation domain-containing protein
VQVNKQKNLRGFTIVELLIATAVFSIILMAAVAGFLQIGRIFYKGVVNTQTQAVTKRALDSITADMQNSSFFTEPATSAEGYTYFCSGNVRYTINPDKIVDISNPDYSPDNGTFGILRDKLLGSNACAPPCESAPCASGAVEFSNPQELLGSRMRLDALIFAPIINVSNPGPPDTYNVKVRVVFGDEESLAVSTPQSRTTDDYECNSSLANSQYCAAAQISNVVFIGGF